MALPDINVVLRRSTVSANPQDLAALPLVTGPSSKGTLNVPQTFMSLSQILDGAGSGPGPELAGAILGVAGGPVVFCPSDKTTLGTAGSVTKTDPAAAVGTPFTLYGGVIVPGADANGRTFIRAKADGVTVTVVKGADGDTLLASAAGSAVTIRTAAAAGAVTTTGADLAAYVLPGPVAALIEQPVSYGTGASLIAVMAVTALDGKIVVTPKRQGVKLKFSTFTGNDTTLSAAVTNTTEITVTPGTNTDSQPVLAKDSATQLKAAIDAVAGALVTVTLGTGGARMSGIGAAYAAAAFTDLVFGSTGTMTVAGDPNDRYDFRVETMRAGTVGGATNPTIRWSADNAASWTGEILVPAGGVIELKDSLLDTGCTITLAQTLAKGDLWSFATTPPESDATATAAAIEGAVGDTAKQWGFATSPDSFDKAGVVVLDAKLQTHWKKRFAQGMFSVRDIGDGVLNETEIQWMDAVSNDFAGFVSGGNANTEAGGLTAVLAAPVRHVSPLSGRQFRRNGTFAAAPRRASIPVHEDLGAVKSGPIRNVVAIYHDEYVRPQLDAQRFITARTYDARPGQFFLTGSPTMADTANVAYSLYEWVSVSLSLARVAKEAAFPFLNDVLQAIAVPDQATGAPAGALTAAEASSIEAQIAAPLLKFLFKVKTDGKVSASSYTGGKRPVIVLRNYNYLQTREIRMEVEWTPLGVAKSILIGVTANLGS